MSISAPDVVLVLIWLIYWGTKHILEILCLGVSFLAFISLNALIRLWFANIFLTVLLLIQCLMLFFMFLDTVPADAWFVIFGLQCLLSILCLLFLWFNSYEINRIIRWLQYRLWILKVSLFNLSHLLMLFLLTLCLWSLFIFRWKRSHFFKAS